MRTIRYKVFLVDDKGILRLFTGTNFKSEGEAQRHAVEAKTTDELVVMRVFINPKDV